MMKSFLMNKIIHYMFINLPMMLNLFMLLLILIPLKYYNFHPMKFLTILILLIFLISFKMNIMFKSWIMFIFPLMMIGGLMIMFMYITSLTNNNLFKINYNNMLLNFLKYLILMCYMFMFMNNKLIMNNQELWHLNFNFNEEYNEMKINELFNFNKSSLLFLMFYLYFSLMIIMNICYKLKTPLRQLYLYE